MWYEDNLQFKYKMEIHDQMPYQNAISYNEKASKIPTFSDLRLNLQFSCATVLLPI